MEANARETRCIRYAAYCRLRALRRTHLTGEAHDKTMLRGAVTLRPGHLWGDFTDAISWLIGAPIICIISPLGNRLEYFFESFRSRSQMLRAQGVPREKTLYSLWSKYGLPTYCHNYTSDDFSDCLCQWTDYLYGQGTAAKLQIAKRLASIEANHPASCKQLDTRDSTGQRIHAIICYRHPTDQLVVQLNDELPPYA